MILIRKHPNKKVVQASVTRWKRRFLKPPPVRLFQDPTSKEWQARTKP